MLLASDFVFREDCRYNFSTPTGNTQLTRGQFGMGCRLCQKSVKCNICKCGTYIYICEATFINVTQHLDM